MQRSDRANLITSEVNLQVACFTFPALRASTMPRVGSFGYLVRISSRDCLFSVEFGAGCIASGSAGLRRMFDEDFQLR